MPCMLSAFLNQQAPAYIAPGAGNMPAAPSGAHNYWPGQPQQQPQQPQQQQQQATPQQQPGMILLPALPEGLARTCRLGHEDACVQIGMSHSVID